MTRSKGLAVTVVIIAAAANLFILGEILSILLGLYRERTDMPLLTLGIPPGLAVVASSILAWLIASLQLRKASVARLDAIGWGALAGLIAALASSVTLGWILITNLGSSMVGSVLIILAVGLLCGLSVLSAVMCRYRGRG